MSSIAFADYRNGWAFAPGLWATHDGGRTWHQIRTRGWQVQSLAAADGQVIAVVSRAQRFRVYSSPAAADRWRAVPGGSGTGFQPSVALAAGTGYLTVAVPVNRAGQPVTAPVLLTGPANRSASWQRIALPCPRWTQYSLPAATTGSLLVGCAGQPGAGSQGKQAYLSTDRGRTWQRLTDPPGSDYLKQVSISPTGTIALSGSRSDVYLSWDRGHTWHGAASTTPSLNATEALTASITTSTQGFIVAPETPYPSPLELNVGKMWLTTDNGHTWVLTKIR